MRVTLVSEEQRGLAGARRHCPSTLTCTLKVHLGHQRPEGSSGRQLAEASHGRLVWEQVDGGEPFLPRGEVGDVQGEGISLAVLQRPLPQDQVHACVTSGGSCFVQDEGLVFKAVCCPFLPRGRGERQQRFCLSLKLCP